MAHYIAELMHRADDATAAPSERKAAARDCADCVLQLWQLWLAREQAQLGYSIYQDRLREPLKGGRDLSAALGEPSSMLTWPIGDRLEALFGLARADEELIRALFLASILRQAASVTPERSRRKARRTPTKGAANVGRGHASAAKANADPPGRAESQEDGVREGFPDRTDVQVAITRAVAAIGTLFPSVARADPSDSVAFQSAIMAALAKTSRLRAVLLGMPTDSKGPSGQAESAQGTRRARPARARRRKW